MGDSHDISKEIKKYYAVFGILILGTILTVGVTYVDFGAHWINIGVGLLIATFKATCVALIFMHLISEKTAIYLVMGFTVFFFIGMMGLTLWASHDSPAL